MAQNEDNIDVVACPFWRSKTPSKINCSEGFSGGRMTITFPSPTVANAQYRARCCNNYRKCPVYKLIINENYGDEEL